MVSKLSEAITKINANFMKSQQGDGGFFKFCELKKGTTVGLLSNKECSCGMDHIAVTNWCNFGLYVTPPKLASAKMVESLAIYPFKPTSD